MAEQITQKVLCNLERQPNPRCSYSEALAAISQLQADQLRALNAFPSVEQGASRLTGWLLGVSSL